METIPLSFSGPELDGQPGIQEVKKRRGRPKKTGNEPVGPFIKGEKIQIVKKFLTEDAVPFWPKELATLNTLYKRYPDINFWRSFVLPYKIKSILWLVGEGKREVERAYFLFHLDWKAKDHIVEGKEKVGEDYKPVNKKPTLLDLLK